MFKWCNQQGIHVTAYGPLSSPHMAATMDKKHLNLLQVCWFLLCVVLETPSFTSLHQAKVPSNTWSVSQHCGMALRHDTISSPSEPNLDVST